MKTKVHMKRFVSFMLVCILAMSMMAFAVAADGQGGLIGTVTANNVNLRTAPNPYDSMNVLGLVHKGDEQYISEEEIGDDSNSWAYGQMQSGQNKGKSGWISESYLTLRQV